MIEYILSVIKLLRPKQWIKNSFVFAALIFSKRFFNINYFAINLYVFIAFCLASSCVYILNDIVDRDKDRIHPEKCKRPIASGKIPVKHAVLIDIILLAVVFAISYSINHTSAIIIISYIVINIFYCFILKNVVIVDVMIITLGFVLRVESGSYAIGVKLSPWLILCTILLSLFIAINKRRSEVLTLKDSSKDHRKILVEYSPELTSSMLSIVTPSILVSYCLYSFQSVQGNKMMLSIPFVLYGLFRYQYLTISKNMGGKPEDFFFKDKPFLINMFLWIVSIGVILYLL